MMLICKTGGLGAPPEVGTRFTALLARVTSDHSMTALYAGTAGDEL